MIKLHKYPIEYYIDRLRSGEHFSFVGYSDAEWYSMLGWNLGSETGLGQIINKDVGDRLADILKRRFGDERFLIATPECMWEDEYFIEAGVTRRMKEFVVDNGIEEMQFYERDMVTDDLAKSGGLYPFIRELRQNIVTVIGNAQLREIEFLHYSNFVEVSSPNLHLEEGGIERAVHQVLNSSYKSQVYLVSAGISAALIIDKLHDELADSFLIDCGSIWDAFVGIGAQRGWREELYRDPEKLDQWKRNNLREYYKC